MTGESLAVIAVILVMAGMLARAYKNGIAILALPLLGVPLFFVLAVVMGTFIHIPAEYRHILLTGAVVLGGFVGAGICFLLSRLISSNRGKTGYFIFSLFFSAAFTFAYLIQLWNQ